MVSKLNDKSIIHHDSAEDPMEEFLPNVSLFTVSLTVMSLLIETTFLLT